MNHRRPAWQNPRGAAAYHDACASSDRMRRRCDGQSPRGRSGIAASRQLGRAYSSTYFASAAINKRALPVPKAEEGTPRRLRPALREADEARAFWSRAPHTTTDADHSEQADRQQHHGARLRDGRRRELGPDGVERRTLTVRTPPVSQFIESGGA